MDNLNVDLAKIGLTITRMDESISVSELNKLTKSLLENNIPIFWIRGEISGIRNYSHAYFDLKDEGGKISCVVFARTLAGLDFKLENGQKIEVRGKVTIYSPTGGYQINVERVRKVGLGELWEAYHRLLNKLRGDGLFDAKFKKKIPSLPKAIGVVTSKEGAVIRDVITTLKRRMPSIPIVIYHTAVQGIDAAMQIAKAIRVANTRNEVEVLIVCRGGGSMEDLWSFNEEIVALEVFNSIIPIISAVGHETDTTIIDFVADVRAPTPTAAAELVAKSFNEWQNLLNKLAYQLNSNWQNLLNLKIQSIDLLYTKIRLLNPVNQLNAKKQQVLNQSLRLHNAIWQYYKYNNNKILMLSRTINPKNINLKAPQAKLDNLANQLGYLMNQLIKVKINQLQMIAKHLELVDPKNILARGYAIVMDQDHQIIRSGAEVKIKDQVQIRFMQDGLTVSVDEIIPVLE